jgi:two-component system chemotaxis response regulator CheB
VLLSLVNDLPADLQASLFIVVHTVPTYASTLPDILTQRGSLPAHHPLHGEKIERAHIYVAPPDAHLMLREGAMDVVRGARENGHRPAVDALFRSASAAYGSRVVGVVLSGHQHCGTAGMASIKSRGGVSVVQDPVTAQAPDMPSNVIAKVPVDHIVHPLELPGLLVRLTGMEAGTETRPGRFIDQLEGKEKGAPAELVCPICQGVLTQAQPGMFEHFRCHTGHAFSLESLVREHSEEMERALWAAVRSLEEGSALSSRLSRSSSADMRHRFEEKSRTQLAHANTIREILLHGAMLHRNDAPLIGEPQLNAAADPRGPDEDPES